MIGAFRAVMAAIEACEPPIAVIGDSDEARRVRTLIGERGLGLDGQRSPATVVEMTGSTPGVAEAFERVADLGTVLLAGPIPLEPLALDLHDQVHVRGLAVVGIDPDDDVTP
jgi:hypothetical protein